MPDIKSKSFVHEDWAVVIAGFLIIIIAIAGFQAPVPAYAWSNFDDLATKVFSGPNLLKIFWQFLLVIAISALVALITGKQLIKTISVFPIIFILTTIALILTGNKQVKA